MSFWGECAEGSFAVLQGAGNDFGCVFPASNGADDEVDVVGFVAGEGLEIFGFDEFAIDEDFIHLGAGGGLGVFLVEAFAAAENGGEETKGFVFGEELAELLADRFGCLGDDGFAGLGAMLHADFGVEEAEEVEISVTVPTVDLPPPREMRCSMATVGGSPSMRSRSGFSSWLANWRA